jgi:diguanylate cyclase (GGDEF)-like protein
MRRVFAITFDSAGELWMLTDKILFHQDRQQQWHAVLQTDPQGGYQTRSMAFAPDGTLWLGSFIDGVTRLHLAQGVVLGRDTFPSRHLASQEVEMMHRDMAGRIWIGTDRGLDVTDGRNWRHLDDQDGLAADDMNEEASFTDNDGTSWFGASGGLSHIIDTRGLFRPVRLHPVVTGISVGSRDLPPLRDPRETLHLQWSGDPLVFAFSSLDFKFERSTRFRYRLRGVDRGWVETAAHEVRYPSLPPGRLVFELVAIDPLHALQSDPVRLTIKVRAPWWRTWPIYLAGILILLGALALLSRLRVRYLLVRQRQLEALVAERTHEIEQARLILLRQATFDDLTGMMNRSAILERLQSAMGDCVPGVMPLGIALLDLDHFKKVNDMFGHLGGDAVLAEVGRRLLANTREGDLAGRYGGEELLLVLPGLKHDAHDRIEALRAVVFAEPFLFEGTTIRMTCSMGVTWMRVEDDITSMIRRADAALYRAKHEGRDRVVFDPPRTTDAGSSEDQP